MHVVCCNNRFEFTVYRTGMDILGPIISFLIIELSRFSLYDKHCLGRKQVIHVDYAYAQVLIIKCPDYQVPL